MFPLLMLAGGLGLREGLDAQERGSNADVMRRLMGEAPGTYAGQENLMEGDPAQITPGSGFRGAFQRSPELLAMLELTGAMAGQKGVTAPGILSMMGQLTQLQHGGRLQNEQMNNDWQRLYATEDFRAKEAGKERDFRSYLQEQGFSQEDIRDEMLSSRQEEKDKRTLARQKELARYQAGLAADKGMKLPTGAQLYQIPGTNQQVIGPGTWTEHFQKTAEAATEARSDVDTVDRLLKSYHGSSSQGREFTGAAGGEQIALYAKFKAALGKAYNKGVLQEFESKEIENVFRSPQTFWSKIAQGDPFTFAVMNESRRQFAGRYENQRKSSPHLYALPEIAPNLEPMPTRESVLAGERSRAGFVPASEAGAYGLKEVAPSARQRARRDPITDYPYPGGR